MSYPAAPALPVGYSFHAGYPDVPQYLHLRAASGLSAKTTSQAAAIATGSWYGCYITYDAPNESPLPIGMGRIIGDGGWYFHIADMAVHPDHQRKGLGDVILKELLRQIHHESPADGKPYITLFADKPGRKLYYKNGFVDSAPGQLGMALKS
ncbi:Acyl-CoA N-acyltransferase [Penicillium argentinense]|uniref:Acyl-CoA N-acyltransferase n=1 Tax=Penicillium argentinense TaxID=1131581 RepID=A0A9W9G1K1_9EURO|nr:Acyl-CoA N-acyltransferase [Penicillium argentinense]KAJ5110411.1 Acyl-CoA N-acyltransferase [Penicillium argentinense]